MGNTLFQTQQNVSSSQNNANTNKLMPKFNRNVFKTSKVLVVGRNPKGCLGIDEHKPWPKSLTQINTNGHNITIIHSGEQSTIYCDDKNYYQGTGDTEQCGMGKVKESNSTLTPISYFDKNNISVIKCCMGLWSSSTFWITKNQQIFANGNNQCGQLGIGNAILSHPKPMLVQDLCNRNISDIKLGVCWSLALNAHNSDMINLIIFKWVKECEPDGYIPNDIIATIIKFYSVSSVLTTKANRCRWKEIEYFGNKNIIEIAVGKDFAMLLGSDGVLYCYGGYGSNSAGELGLGHTESVELPATVNYFIDNGIKLKHIACGMMHTLALDENGKIYSWGMNNDAQCGHGNNNNQHHIDEPKCIESLSNCVVDVIKCGGWHSYCKTVDDKHFLWGSNADGECLTSTRSTRVRQPLRFNGLKRKQKIIDVSLARGNTKLIVE